MRNSTRLFFRLWHQLTDGCSLQLQRWLHHLSQPVRIMTQPLPTSGPLPNSPQPIRLRLTRSRRGQLAHAFWAAAFLLSSTLLPNGAQAQEALALAKPKKATDATTAKAEAALKKQQDRLTFEQNTGQLDNPAVRFRTRDVQATHFFTKTEMRSVVTNKTGKEQTAYALQFMGANPAVELEGVGQAPRERGAINYITHSDTYANVPLYSRLNYRGLWEGVDALFYEGKQGSMEYDFLVQPNADPSAIRFRLEGATNLHVNAKGELAFTTPFGTLQKGRPYTYQVVAGKEVAIKSEYVVEQGEVRFKLGAYDHSLPLTIDPIALKWSTYLGGAAEDFPLALYVHPTTGRIYLTGFTTSSNFPSTLGRTYAGRYDVFVSCLEKDGTALVWSTILGGTRSNIVNGDDAGDGIAVDQAGDVYVAGYTQSTNFPTNGTVEAYSATLNGGQDFFILRLNPTGNTLKYSTYLGGPGTDQTRGLRLIEKAGKVYYGGAADNGFPITTGSFSEIFNRGGVWFCLNTNVAGAAGLEVSVATRTGEIVDLVDDKDGNIWIAGNSPRTYGAPVSANAVQPSLTAIDPNNILPYWRYLAKYTPTGQFLYGTFLHPFYSNVAWGSYITPRMKLATDREGNLYFSASDAMRGVAGNTANIKRIDNIDAVNEITPISTSFHNFNDNAILTYIGRIPYDLSPKYDFITTLPGAMAVGFFSCPEIDVDKKGNIHVATWGGNFYLNQYHPVTDGAIQPIVSTAPHPEYYILNPSGSSVLYGTALNHESIDGALNLFVADNGQSYITVESTGQMVVTPTYRDPATNTQKAVLQPDYAGGTRDVGLFVFHDPVPNNNTIPNFATGNNTFCIGGAIWQNPNDGPIRGATPTYLSGNGSLATHNLPNLKIGSTITPHPAPKSPALSYQWQKRVNGGAWTNVGNGTFEVYKPAPEPSAGTVDYRRLVIGFYCDTLSISNLASATISATFNLSINAPTKPVYYCPGTVTPLGVTLAGASGNVSWQWYDGYAPVSSTVISPASGTGVAPTSFAASIAAGVKGSGFYRLVVVDAGGCRREAFVAISPKVASAGSAPALVLCPGTSATVVLGPPAVNPDFDYRWTGPASFTSTLPNPTVTTAGVYTLQVKLKTDAAYCTPGTSVTVNTATAHAAVLTNLTNLTFCQGDTPAPIGLSGTPPAGYVFQWVPATSLDNAQAFRPTFDPGVVNGGFPIGTTNYTFTALRLSDGCIFERTMSVTNTALGFASAGNDLVGDGCVSGRRNGVGAVETKGQYFQWTAIKTDFAAGLAALKANAAFGMDALTQQTGTNKFLNALFPLCSANGNKGYYIDYELRASYLPFPNTCFTQDTVRVFIPCCGGQGLACPIPTASLSGSGGACSSPLTVMQVAPLQGATYVWRTYSINGTIQPANTPPRGLFVSNNGVKGAPLSATGPHPTSVIVDFDDATWGWSGSNVVVYEVTQTVYLSSGPVSCFARLQVFSGRNALPVIGLKDLALCSIPAPGTRVGTAGQAGPYTLSGLDYTQAPSSAFTWTWTSATGGVPTSLTNAASPFPTLNPTATTAYIVQAQDPVTGCVARDTLTVKVNAVRANAGASLNAVCPGTLVQLGTGPSSNTALTYAWAPTAGLNFPVGTPNSTVANPYLAVPGVPTPPAVLTYTLTVTDPETGCQASHSVSINTTSTAPAAIAAASYSACAGATFAIGPSSDSDVGATFQWSLVSGPGNLSWLSSTTVFNPTVTLPATFTGPVVFRLTKTKGNCGSVTADFTINNYNPPLSLGGPYLASCASPYLQIGETSLAGYTYTWSPTTGLFTNSGLTTPYTGTDVSRLFVGPLNASTTYTLVRRNDVNGCEQRATVTVNPPAGVAANAGANQTWCPGSAPVSLGQSGSGTLTWTAVGYSPTLTGGTSPTAIAAPMTSAQMLGYLSATSGAIVTFRQTTVVPGTYVYRLTSTSGTCSVTDDVVVRVASIQTGLAGLPQTICKGSSVQLGLANAPLYNYTWTPLNPALPLNTLTDANTARPTARPLVTTTYQMLITDPVTGCQADEQVTVVVNPGPNLSNVSTPTACAPLTAVNLTAQIPGYATFTGQQWFRDQYPGGAPVSTPTAVTPTATTTYFVVLADNLGCKDTVQVRVNVANPQTPGISATGSLDCATQSFDLVAAQGTPSQPGYTLEWYTTPNRAVGTLVTSQTVGVGTYYLFEKAPAPASYYSGSAVVTVSSLCFCVTPTNVVATVAPNSTTVNTTLSLSASASNTTPGSTSYTWSGPGISSPTATTVAGLTVAAPATGGSYTYTVVVSNGTGCTATATASVTVIPPALTVQVSAPVCNSLTNNYTATGTVSLSNVPAGTLTITDNGSSLTTITVTAGQTTASFSVSGMSDASSHTVVATLIGGTSASVTYFAPVACTVCSTSITTASLPNGQVNTPYSQTLTASGGTAPYTFAVVGTLPTGLSLNPTTGEISGTPTVAVTSSVTVTVSDGKSCTDAQPLSITIANLPVCLLTATATPTVCNSVTNQYTVTGTVTATNAAINSASPQSLTISVGSVSTVVTLTDNGPVSYTLSGLNSDGLTKTVSVLSSATACGQASVTYTAPTSCTVAPPALTVQVSAPVCNSLTNTYTATGTVSLTNAVAGTLTITDNGTSLTTITITAGQTTASFSVSGVSDASSHTVVATLTGGFSASVVYTAPVACTVCSTSITTAALANGQVDTPYNQTLTVSGGTAPYTFAVVGTLPTGLSLNPTTGEISGTPTSPTTTSFSITVTVSDGRSCTDAQPLSITIANLPVCSLMATATPTTCNTLTNQYTLTGTVSSTNAAINSASPQSLTISVGIVTTTVTLTGDGPVSYTLSGLNSDGLTKTVTVLSSATACGQASVTFTAPASCTVAPPALSVQVSAPVCNSLSNNYTATGTVSLTNAVAGTLAITDNGTTIGTVSVTAGQTTASFSVSGISDASSHTVVATLTGGTSASATYSAPLSCTQTSSPSLQVTKQVSLSKARLGDILSYTIVLTNTATTPATNVVLTDSATAGLKYIPGSATVPTGTTFTQGNPISLWYVAALNPAQSIHLTFQARADTTGILYNKATVPGDTAIVCTTIPVKVCQAQVFTFQLTVPAGRSRYRWYKDGREITDQTTNTLLVSQPGSYSLALDDLPGSCAGFSCCPFIVELDSLPVFQAKAISASCSGTSVQSNGQLRLSGVKPGFTYQYSPGSRFNAPAALPGVPQAIPADGVLVSDLASPPAAQAYTVRVYNSSGCFTDQTVWLLPTVCGCPAEVCVPFVLKQTRRPQRIGDPR